MKAQRTECHESARSLSPAVIASMALHTAVIVFFCWGYAAPKVPVYSEQPGPPVTVIQARSISAQQLDQALASRAKQIAAVRQAKRRAIARRKRLARERQIAKARALRVAKAKRLYKKKSEQSLQDQLAHEQAQLQQRKQQLLAQRKKAEAQRLARMESAKQSGLVDEYKARIVNAIRPQWHYPPGTDSRLYSILSVRLAPGGVVLSVTLLQSSGNAALDRSAQRAVKLASPLPVPKQAALFDKLRQLRLTMRPEQ